MTERDDALSDLYTRLIDSRDGCRAALERAESPAIETVLTRMAERRETDAAQIRQFLAATGVNPSDDGSTPASAHRAFLSLRDSVTGQGDEAILGEIARGEDALLDAYAKAIDATGPADPETAFLREQRDALRAEVERLRARTEAS